MRAASVALAAIFLGVSPIRTAPGSVASSSCESLASLAMPQATVTRAQLVPAGRFAATPEGILASGATAFRPYSLLPDFCRVALTLSPSSDSDIKVEVWMPAGTSWNGKFEAVGNGGWAGQLSVQALAGGVARGYAIAATDTGHATPGASFAFGHPEKLTDFAYRAVHEMTVSAKTLIDAYYGHAPRLSYWTGCSTGGRQGLKEAQRYPDDYDGIVAGAPASDMPHLLAQSIWVAQAVAGDGAIPREKFAIVHQAAIEACDAADGVKDGVIDDPTRCGFDPKTIECPGADSPACLMPAQAAAVRKIYSPARNPRTGAELFPGQEPGSEMGWFGGLAGPTPLSIATDYWKYVVFKRPDWNFTTLDFDKDVTLANSLDQGEMNAMDSDLKAFVAHGGKLLLYHGWNDQLIAPLHTVNYYTAVVNDLGGAARATASVRLFMEPGVTHCAGGDGPSNFDPLGVIERWVEQKQAPDSIIATHLAAGVVDRARPLCPYPQVAIYRGSGDTNKAENFACGRR